MFNSAERLISYRNLKPKKKDGFLRLISLFSFLGIALGVAILIIVMSVMNGFRTELTNKILGLNAHITIDSNGNKISKELKKEITEKFPNNKYYRSYQGEGIILTNNNAKGVIVKGVEKSNLLDLFSKEKIIEGSLDNFDEGDVIVGGELAFNLNLKVNDKINIMSSSFMDTPLGGLPKKENYTIAAIFNSGFYEFDQNLIYLNLKDSLSLYEKTEKDVNLEIYMSNPIQANSLKDKLQTINSSYFVYSWSDVNKSFFSALKVERNVMFIILILIIIVAAFNIISGLTILIKNKTKEIAILKTLGFSNLSIKKTFFLTGFIIGFIATVIGIILGLIFSIYIENIRVVLSALFNLNIFPPDVYFLDEMPSEINFLSILVIFTCSIIITSIASYFPASAISKMDMIRALKYE